MGIATHLQGEGTYTYQCDKADCYACQLLGLKYIPQPNQKLKITVSQLKNHNAYHRQYRALKKQKMLTGWW